MKDIRVAIIHYWFVSWRGGEKVVHSLLKLFPNADIYTLFYDREICGKYFKNNRITSSILDIKMLRSKYQKIYPLYPIGIKSLKLKKKYDLIISSESGPAKGIARINDEPHLCYIHTPMRYCWGFTKDYLDSMSQLLRPIAKIGFEYLRRYDVSTIDNVDLYVANSVNVKNRVHKYYNKEASVVYPPINLSLFEKENMVNKCSSEREYYLSFGAITPYKNINLLVETFNRNGKKLIIIGDGSERKKLMAKANKNVLFTGALPFNDVRRYILNSKALLFPGEEDFGMVPLEVMAHGIPVIALGKGGALETVVQDIKNPALSSGMFFSEPKTELLQQAIDKFELIQNEFSPEWIRTHARKFGEDIFHEKILNEVKKII